ncbi:MAG: DUF6489 family protein, partial [Propionibacteriaceae bacterium]|nr:DUF6489 family protein [Propionibacteriaceae bacterium]
MNISVNVDCTPAELRAFLGLPDVAPMQKSLMDALEQRMLESMETLSPTTMMREWFTPSGSMHQALLNLFQAGRMQS